MERRESAAKTNLVLLGPPGAGKGTQASRLVEEFGLVHISTGDILRRAVAEGTEVGKRAQEYMDRGELVPDGAVVSLVASRIGEEDCRGRGWLLDGFPRNAAQAAALEEQTRSAGLPGASAVVYLKVSSETVVERLSGRRSCPSCGATYHVKFLPPQTDGVCDKCGGKLTQRDDDKPAAIEKRLQTYEERTRELVSRYRKAGLLIEVAADAPPDEVARNVARKIEKRQSV